MKWFLIVGLLFFGLLWWQIEVQENPLVPETSFNGRSKLSFFPFFSEQQQFFLCSLTEEPELWVSRGFSELFIRFFRKNPLIDFLFYRLYYSFEDRHRILSETAFIIYPETDSAHLAWVGAFAEQEKLLRLLPEKIALGLDLTGAAPLEFRVNEHVFFISRRGDYLILATSAFVFNLKGNPENQIPDKFLHFSSRVLAYLTNQSSVPGFFENVQGSVSGNEISLNFSGVPERISNGFLKTELPEKVDFEAINRESLPQSDLLSAGKMPEPFIDIKFELRRELPKEFSDYLVPPNYRNAVQRILRSELWSFLRGNCQLVGFMDDKRFSWRVKLSFLHPGASARAIMEIERLIISAGGVFQRNSEQNFAFALPFLPRDLYLQRNGAELYFADTGDFSILPFSDRGAGDLFHIYVQSSGISEQLLPEMEKAMARLDFQSSRECFMHMRQKDEVFMRCPDGPVYEIKNGDFHCPLHGSPINPMKKAGGSNYPELLSSFLQSFQQMNISADFKENQLQLKINF